jgi:PIN domain nuclease of toxin-antitoxin system
MIPSAVIDTHTAVWYLNAAVRLSDRAKRLIIDEAGRRGAPVLISSISLVEVVYLGAKGRIPPESFTRLQHALRLQGSALRVADPTPNRAQCDPGDPQPSRTHSCISPPSWAWPAFSHPIKAGA